MYDEAITFNATKYSQFLVMIDTIGQYSIGMKGPIYHEAKILLLNKEVKDAIKYATII